MLGLGCTKPNPAYRGSFDGAAPDAAGGASGDSGIDTKPDTATDSKTDSSIDTTTDRPPDTVGDTRTDTKSDAGDGGFVCSSLADCMAHFGNAPCGSWTCPAGACVLNCPNCTDADGDGYGIGTGCLGPDCDDTDPAIHDTVASRSCPVGPAGTVLMGTCRAGTQACTAGVWSTCSGQVLPSGEACNGEDDDCNGMTDDALPEFTCGLGACLNMVPSCGAGVLAACVPHTSVATSDTCNGLDDDCDGQVDEDCPAVIAACVHVSPDGDDGTGDGSTTAPYQTIPMAISIAFNPTGTSRPVCVAGGRTCQDRTTYKVGDGSTTPVTLFQMENGVSVYGSYEATNWTQCQPSATAPNPTVTLQLGENGGVRFPNTINLPTALDGFVLARNNSGSAPALIAAVTVNGAKHVQLSNLVINDAPSADQTFGVRLVAGGQALITHSLIYGGAGTTASYGVGSFNSTPVIRDNCLTINPTTGHCTTDCSMTPSFGIAGSNTANAGISAAVLLNTSPGASIETSTLCGAQGTQAIGVRIVGDATGTLIRGSSISAAGGTTSSLGILAEDCNNAAPWIVGNELVQGQGTGRAAGILARGTCDPVIDGNTLIAGGGDTTTTESDGISCETNASNEASRCAVLGNEKIQSATSGRPTVWAGVACKNGACVRVADNIVSGGSASDVRGVWLLKDGTMVERNRITGGCGGQSAVGLLADDSFARIQNNLISAGACQNTLSASPTNIGLRVFGANDQNEIDVDSNTIDGGGNAALTICTSAAIELGIGTNTAPAAPKGMVRNNILSGGACSLALTTTGPIRADFSEARATTDPRLFQNNDLDPSGTPLPTLYWDEGTTARTSADMVNGLTDITTSGNISASPMFASPPTDLRLGTGSACIGAGTPVGAPATDFDGKARSTTKPSVGAYE